ncbi:MAG: MFS transporter [Deltaproteobacteria bacterium]|jgi:MFS family permease|nr:MFS transporter [Deltaproteobacteria bacterium]
MNSNIPPDSSKFKNQAGVADDSQYDQPPDRSELNRRKLILWTAISANILGNLGLTGINVAIPSIQKEMGLSAFEVGWLSLSTMLVMAMFSAPVARAADLYGRKRFTIVGLLITMLCSVAAALSNSFQTLFISRAFSGLGLVTFFTTITTMITAAYPAKERGRVLGLTISSVYVGLSMGPILTGFLVELFGWRSLFWFTVLGMLPPLVLINLVSRADELDIAEEKFDAGGVVVWICAVGLGFTGLASLRQNYAIGILAIGLIFGVFFFFKAVGNKNPIIDTKLFLNSRRFTFSSLAAYISYLSSTSVIFLLSLYFQYAKGLSPSKAGMFLISQPVIQALLTPLSGRLSDRYDAGKLASAGMGIILLAIVIFAFTLSINTSNVLLVLTMGLTGAGFAFFSAPNTNAILSAAPQNRLGQASGVITVTRLCGQISSIALTTLIFDLVIGPGAITEEKYPAFIRAAKICFVIFAPLCLTGIAASLARGKQKT